MKLNTTKFKNRKWFQIKHDCSKENKWLWSTRMTAFMDYSLGHLGKLTWFLIYLSQKHRDYQPPYLCQSSWSEQKKKPIYANTIKIQQTFYV